MKALFLIFHGFEEANGISKKIRYQIKALKRCGLDICVCHYSCADQDAHWKWMVDDETLKDLGQSSWGKIKKRIDYSSIINYIVSNKIEFLYLRSYHNANPFILHFVNTIKKHGTKVVMEIPTYPYDQEYITKRMKLELLIDKCFRKRLAKKLDGIITFSDAKTIFGRQTIRISNGIDFDSIPLKTQIGNTENELHLIGVAEIHYWHGFDRLIHGLADYYDSNPQFKIFFHIVGECSGERERQSILPIIHENHLEPYVLLHGKQYGQQLDDLFELANMGIGSLGRHRSGITNIKTLKNREYAARGIPFVYSETDSDFDNRPYIFKVPADESPVNIPKLIQFYKRQKWNMQEIRSSIKHLSWEEQMRKVLAQI